MRRHDGIEVLAIFIVGIFLVSGCGTNKLEATALTKCLPGR